ncbi:hypothetical protein [Nocardia jejuensis]|uniref:hypothetical protein n=1 Tax=Nocardia jejuensis TaxID=328049 RepID=UPI00082AEDDD|nr:hypothetical protein [Nocardia jejuensis]
MTSPEPTNAAQVISAAIELLTMWVSEGDDARDAQAEYIGRRITDLDETGRIHLIRGQLYLNELLLLSVAEANGASGPEALRASGVQWLRELALEIAQ